MQLIFLAGATSSVTEDLSALFWGHNSPYFVQLSKTVWKWHVKMNLFHSQSMAGYGQVFAFTLLAPILLLNTSEWQICCCCSLQALGYRVWCNRFGRQGKAYPKTKMFQRGRGRGLLCRRILVKSIKNTVILLEKRNTQRSTHQTKWTNIYRINKKIKNIWTYQLKF